MKRNDSAFSLIEVTLSLGIVAFALVALLGLLPAGMMTVKDTADERRAASILSAVESDLRNIPEGDNESKIYGIPGAVATSADEAEKFLGATGSPVSAQADADYVLSWKVNRPTPTTAGEPTTVWVRIGWPGRSPNPKNWMETIITIGDRNL